MNTRQVHIFFNFSKVIQENCLIIHVFCKSWEPEVVFVLICIICKTISWSQISWINIVLHWIFRKISITRVLIGLECTTWNLTFEWFLIWSNTQFKLYDSNLNLGYEFITYVTKDQNGFPCLVIKALIHHVLDDIIWTCTTVYILYLVCFIFKII